MQDILFNILAGAISGGVVASFLAVAAKTWLSKKISYSIAHNYNKKLEEFRGELNAAQLRTSLFFEHQREAFSKILKQLIVVKEKWAHDSHTEELGIQFTKVPYEEYSDFKKIYHDHMLFFDDNCMLAIDEAIKAMESSFPIDYGTGQMQSRDCEKSFEVFEFLIPKISDVFRQKIGTIISEKSIKDIAYLCGIRLLNNHHFPDIKIPDKGLFKIDRKDSCLDMIRKAQLHEDAFLSRLTEFRDYLLNVEGFFFEAIWAATRCLDVLTPTMISSN